MMNDLELANHAHKTAMEFETLLIASTLERSKGEPEMSNADMKLAILRLIGICKNQEKMIQKLVAEANIAKEERQSAINRFLDSRK